MAITHATVKAPGQTLEAVADWNADHVGEHAAVTVADTATVDLTLAGQQISAEVIKQMSIDSDVSGLKLSGDSVAPGATKLYGTDAGGTKGWYTQEGVSSTEIQGLIDPQVNISSVGDTYIDVMGNTYAETTHQTRITASAVRTQYIYGRVSWHVSAGTGSVRLFNFTDGTSLGTKTTTSLIEVDSTGMGGSPLTTDKGDQITLTVKNSTAGASVTIDTGGMIAADNGQGITSIQILPMEVKGGFPTMVKIAVLKVFSTATSTVQMAQIGSLGSINTGQLTNLGAVFGAADNGTVVTRTPLYKTYGTSAFVFNVTALGGGGTTYLGVSAQIKADDI